jgi:hypothetical protein
MYTQAEHRTPLPARAAQVREQKNPRFPEISAFESLRRKIEINSATKQ